MPTAPRSRSVAWALGLFLGVVFLSSMTRSDVTNDVQTTQLISWRIAMTGTPWFDGYDYEQWTNGAFILWIFEAPNGHLAGFRSPGPVAAGIPAYTVMRLLGQDEYSVVPGSVTAVLLTLAALLILHAALRTRLSPTMSALSVLVLALTTPVWSVSSNTLLTHPVTALGTAGMAWAGARDRWWLAGVFGGVALWGRLHMALVVAILGLGVALARREPGIAVRVGLASGGFLGLAFLWGRWMYGSWTPAGGYSVSMYTENATDTSAPVAALVNHLGLWIAPDRGLLIWTPALVLLLPAVIRSWRELPDWTRWLAYGGLAYALVQGQLNAFTGGSGFFGYRLMLEPLLCVFPAYALSARRMGRHARAVLPPLLGLQFAATCLGAAGDAGMLPKTAAWTANSFVHALTLHPVLILWPMLTMAAAWGLGRLISRRANDSSVHASGMSTPDQLDRV